MEDIIEETIELIMGVLTDVLVFQIKRLFAKIKHNGLTILHFTHWCSVLFLFSYLYLGSALQVFGSVTKPQEETANQYTWINIIPVITVTETSIHFLSIHIINQLKSREYNDQIPYKSIMLLVLKCQYLYTPFLPLSETEYANVPWIVQILPLIDGATAFLFFTLSLYYYHLWREPEETVREARGGSSRSTRNNARQQDQPQFIPTPVPTNCRKNSRGF